jgi:hypothetical protein
LETPHPRLLNISTRRNMCDTPSISGFYARVKAEGNMTPDLDRGLRYLI